MVSVLAVAGFAACGNSGGGGGGGGGGGDLPVISDVSNPSATDDGTNYNVTFDVDFADSDSGGEDVSAYTFTTTDLGTEVDDQDATICPPSMSPVTITTQIPVADDGSVSSVDCTVALFDSDGVGTAFDFTLTVVPSSQPQLIVHRKGTAETLSR